MHRPPVGNPFIYAPESRPRGALSRCALRGLRLRTAFSINLSIFVPRTRALLLPFAFHFNAKVVNELTGNSSYARSGGSLKEERDKKKRQKKDMAKAEAHAEKRGRNVRSMIPSPFERSDQRGLTVCRERRENAVDPIYGENHRAPYKVNL